MLWYRWSSLLQISGYCSRKIAWKYYKLGPINVRFLSVFYLKSIEHKTILIYEICISFHHENIIMQMGFKFQNDWFNTAGHRVFPSIVFACFSTNLDNFSFDFFNRFEF